MWIILVTQLLLVRSIIALPPELMDDVDYDDNSHNNNSNNNFVLESEKVVVSKCCAVDAVLVESALGVRSCQGRGQLTLDEEAITKWSPTFHDLLTEEEVPRPNSYQLDDRYPSCDHANGEVMFPVYHHEHTDDVMLLLPNGSLAHRLVHQSGLESKRVLYPPGKYCVDDMIVAHNHTSGGDQMAAAASGQSVVEFAYICVSNKLDLQSLIDTYVYPIGVAVSMMCLICTFLLYSFLPQLRDLTGKFILGICAFLAATLALLLVDLFGWRDPNVQKLVTELCLQTCVLGIWLCLSCMGHHVWKILLSKSVFTRVTDGRRLCYYSAYVISSMLVVVAAGVAVHYFAAEETSGSGSYKIGWECLTAFQVPITVLLLVNVYFYITAQRSITRQIVYNRSMQHFQVNFDLFVKFLIVVGVWWLFFLLSLLEEPSLAYIAKTFHALVGPLVFCVSMCRTRVAFLFKRYFCLDCCCRPPGEFIEAECKELSVIDGLRLRHEEEDGQMPHSRLLGGQTADDSDYREMSKSLFCVRPHQGEVPPPPDPTMPVGRVKRLLKSNSLTALANINWGWRRETSV